jgi:hypothetical protein
MREVFYCSLKIQGDGLDDQGKELLENLQNMLDEKMKKVGPSFITEERYVDEPEFEKFFTYIVRNYDLYPRVTYIPSNASGYMTGKYFVSVDMEFKDDIEKIGVENVQWSVIE